MRMHVPTANIQLIKQEQDIIVLFNGVVIRYPFSFESWRGEEDGLPSDLEEMLTSLLIDNRIPEKFL